MLCGWILWGGSVGDILYKRSTDGGVIFGSTINLSNNAGDSSSPVIAALGNIVYAIWEDGSSGNDDILYTTSANGGATFSGILTNISDNGDGSFAPAIAIS